MLLTTAGGTSFTVTLPNEQALGTLVADIAGALELLGTPRSNIEDPHLPHRR